MLVFIIGSLFFSSVLRLSIMQSLRLCADILIPALFLYLICSGMLIDFGIDAILPSAWCCFILGLICGYPTGTKSVCNFYENGMLSKQQANALLLCTANASPAFIIIALGIGILKNKYLGFLLFAAQSVCSFILFVLCVKRGNRLSQSKTIPLIPTLITNIKNAGEQLMFICGSTVFFGIFYDLLHHTLQSTFITKLFLGMIEIVHGTTLFSENDIIALSFLIGFSGIGIWIQCIYYIQHTDLNAAFLILGKIAQSILIPCAVSVFVSNDAIQKVFALAIIILTNAVVTCIIKHKGCETNDFFKKHRKMLRILRTRNQNRNERTSAVSS